MSEYALIAKIEFSEAHFKVHQTKGFRLTYPIPLPTSVAGIFASMLGIERQVAAKRFRDHKFGAALVGGRLKETVEQVTFHQYGKNRMGVARTHILVDPAYYLVYSCRLKKEIEDLQRKIENGVEYLPFGGQNDFFATDWRVVSLKETTYSSEIANYLPANFVQTLVKGVSLEVLPVKHKLRSSEDFYFVLDGHLMSTHEMPVCSMEGKNIALYGLEDFYLVGDWVD